MKIIGIGILGFLTASIAGAAMPVDVNAYIAKRDDTKHLLEVVVGTCNTTSVNASLTRLDANAWLRSPRVDVVPTTIGAPVKSWVMEMKSPGVKMNKNQRDRFYSRTVALPWLDPGLYVLKITKGFAKTQLLINYSRMNVVFKQSRTKGLVWVTDRENGAVLPNVQVTFFSSKGAKVGGGKTDREGILFTKLKPVNVQVLVNKGKDANGVRSSYFSTDGSLDVHFQTDRPVYRPGQTIYYKAILRRKNGQVYRNLPNTKVEVELHDESANVVDEAQLTSNAMGSVVGSFDIPSEAAVGSNTIVVKVGKEQSEDYVQIEAYRKPEFQVEAICTAKRLFAGEKGAFRVNASYYFGAPLAQAKVKYTIRKQDQSMWGGDPSDDDQGFDYGGDFPNGSRRYGVQDIATGTVYTDKKGVVTIPFNTTRDSRDSTYSITCQAFDSSNREVFAEGSVPVYASSIRVGIKSTVSYAPLGSLFPVQVQTLDIDGKPVSAGVTLKMKDVVYNAKTKIWSPRVLLTTSTTTDAKGNATVNLPAKVEGYLTLVASVVDKNGRQTTSSMSFWVAGPGAKPDQSRDNEMILVKLNKKDFRVGDTASAFVRSKDKQKPMLIVFEGEEIWGYWVVPAGQRTKQLMLKTTALLAPNAYLEAGQWERGYFQTRNKTLPILNPAWKLNVQAKADKASYRPGDKASYTLSTFDVFGKPRSAELSLSVIDEAIYAIQKDNTTDLFGHYWKDRENKVVTTSSRETDDDYLYSPQMNINGYAKMAMKSELADSSGWTGYSRHATREFQFAKPQAMGGALLIAGNVQGSFAPVVRKQFQDTAYWNPTILTDASGLAKIEFEVPSDLTTWKAIARGITLESLVGTGSGTFKSNRDAMLRLSLPRQMVVGDSATIVATVDNRSNQNHMFTVSLDAKGIQLEGESTQTVTVPANGQATVAFPLVASELAPEGYATLTGTLIVTDAPSDQQADLSDALQLPLRIIPKGVQEHVLGGGAMVGTTDATFTLPEDAILPASMARLTVWQGFGAAFRKTADEVLESWLFGSLDGASHLEASVALGKTVKDKEVRECLAMLMKFSDSEGWGWWEKLESNPLVTARVSAAVGYARICGMKVYPSLLETAKTSCQEQFKKTNLWEYKALLASASVLVGDPTAKTRLDQVLAKGESLSPYARLRMAEAYALLNDKASAEKLVASVLANQAEGPVEAFLPSGEGSGWTASDTETTAQGLVALLRLDDHPELQAKFARWLALPHNERWLSGTDQAALVRGLHLYVKKHPESPTLGLVTVEVGGKTLTATPAKVGTAASVDIPAALLVHGVNSLKVTAGSASEVLYSINATIFRPSMVENSHGVRILRRYEVRNAAGIWEELKRPVKTSEPVRCTVMVWGDDLTDALKVNEPIPSGFEYVESESTDYWSDDKVYDGAVVHYLGNAGYPQVFRYYLRAEVEGKLVALPATGEYVRRPTAKGQSNAEGIEVKK